MDVETSRDALSLDPELLQLPEVSPLALKENPHLAEQLYSQWLSLPDTVRLVALRCDGRRSRTDEEAVDGLVKCEEWIRDEDSQSEDSNTNAWLKQLMRKKHSGESPLWFPDALEHGS